MTHANEAHRWAARLDDLCTRIAPRFGRIEPRRRARAYVQGLLSPLERKNGWHLAEAAGDASPDGVQDFLARMHWDADAVRDDLRAYAVEHLGDPDAVLVLDETGFVKKGDKSAGVKRQYSGTAGRIENCQIGVFLAYASRHGHALIDRALYLPETWAFDAARRAEAGVPESVSFTTKPKLGQAMLKRAFEVSVPCRWVVGDCVYGADHQTRRLIEAHGRGYVLAVTSAQRLGFKPVEDWLDDVPARGWQRLSAGDGAKGPRLYDWAYLPYRTPPVPGWKTGLLIRRKKGRPHQFTFYLTRSPEETALAALVRIAGQRWRIESCFEEAKARPDWTSTRSARGRAGTGTSPYPCWPMPISRSCVSTPSGGEAPVVQAAGLLPFTVPEVRRLLWHLVWERPPSVEAVEHWSVWRRRHQQRARECHWRQRTRRRRKSRL